MLPSIHLLIVKHPLFARYVILSKYIAPPIDNKFHADIPLVPQSVVLKTYGAVLLCTKLLLISAFLSCVSLTLFAILLSLPAVCTCNGFHHLINFGLVVY